MVFVNSMSDLFHEGISDDYIHLVAEVMAAADWHIYQVLTKRSDRLWELLATKLRFAAARPHIWWGVSVENQRHGLPRVRHLREADPALGFLSIEPLLEDLGEIDLRGIDWVIVVGESGGRARPMERKWVVNIRRQCRQANIPFFSSNGAVSARAKTDARRIVGPTTTFHKSNETKYPTRRGAGSFRQDLRMRGQSRLAPSPRCSRARP